MEAEFQAFLRMKLGPVNVAFSDNGNKISTVWGCSDNIFGIAAIVIAVNKIEIGLVSNPIKEGAFCVKMDFIPADMGDSVC